MNPYRVAIYFAPEAESPHQAAGQGWLGLGPTGCAPIPIQAILGEQRTDVLLTEPRRYGFHGTLKAPFRLASGVSWSDFLNEVRGLAARLLPFTLAPLEVRPLDNFLALQAVTPDERLSELASRCVQDLHHLASPLNENELLRRRKAPLSSRQEQLMLAWGYPYVLDEFRFHMTLTGPMRDLSEGEHMAIVEAAQATFEPLGPWPVDQLSVFVQATPQSAFEMLEQVPLGAA